MTVVNNPSLIVDTARYLGQSTVRRVLTRQDISISDRAYLPRLDDLSTDWVATVAAPAFRLILAQRGADACRSFCSIGTGSGLDALAAVEILGASVVGVTDLFADVVRVAADNIARNHHPDHPLTIHAGHGDLLSPLAGRGVTFDVIYENLPNIPLLSGQALDVARTSSAYVPDRTEQVPQDIRDNLLHLHYLALGQARDFLAPQGIVLSTLGGRVPLADILAMASRAGFYADFLTYTWKAQVDPDEMISSYAAWQAQGLGPFVFYPADVLDRVFSPLDIAQAGRDALAIEADLLPHRLDALSALAALRSGTRIGHTVAVLRSFLD